MNDYDNSKVLTTSLSLTNYNLFTTVCIPYLLNFRSKAVAIVTSYTEEQIVLSFQIILLRQSMVPYHTSISL
jgi:hypothetical protein